MSPIYTVTFIMLMSHGSFPDEGAVKGTNEAPVEAYKSRFWHQITFVVRTNKSTTAKTFGPARVVQPKTTIKCVV